MPVFSVRLPFYCKGRIEPGLRTATMSTPHGLHLYIRYTTGLGEEDTLATVSHTPCIDRFRLHCTSTRMAAFSKPRETPLGPLGLERVLAIQLGSRKPSTTASPNTSIQIGCTHLTNPYTYPHPDKNSIIIIAS